MDMIRCDWANKSELEKIYHDTKWGKPVHDDKEIFKMFSLEGMQAGLSWLQFFQSGIVSVRHLTILIQIRS